MVTKRQTRLMGAWRTCILRVLQRETQRVAREKEQEEFEFKRSLAHDAELLRRQEENDRAYMERRARKEATKLAARKAAQRVARNCAKKKAKLDAKLAPELELKLQGNEKISAKEASSGGCTLLFGNDPVGSTPSIICNPIHGTLVVSNAGVPHLSCLITSQLVSSPSILDCLKLLLMD